MMTDKICADISGSKASPQAPTGLVPTGYDPGRVPRVAFAVFKDAWMSAPRESNWDDKVMLGLAAAQPYLGDVK